MVSFYESILHPNGYIALFFLRSASSLLLARSMYTPPCSLHSLPYDVQAIVDATLWFLVKMSFTPKPPVPSPRGCGTFVGSSLLHPPSFASADRL